MQPTSILAALLAGATFALAAPTEGHSAPEGYSPPGYQSPGKSNSTILLKRVDEDV